MNLTPARPLTPTGAFLSFGERLRNLSTTVGALSRRVAALESAGIVRVTNGEPEASLGNDGDVAYDPNTNTLYGPKSSGGWPNSGER